MGPNRFNPTQTPSIEPDQLKSVATLLFIDLANLQCILLLFQDLLKHTAKDHHDRLSLQLALTELETLTHRLNESKRESETRNEAKHFTNHLMGRHSVKSDAERFQVRRDNLYQVVSLQIVQQCSFLTVHNKERRNL